MFKKKHNIIIGIILIGILLAGNVKTLSLPKNHRSLSDNSSNLIDSNNKLNKPKKALKGLEEFYDECAYEYMYPQDPNKPVPLSLNARIPIDHNKKQAVGQIKIAVILIYFKCGSYQKSPSYFYNLLFNKSNPKSCYSYYYENSYGAVNLTGEIVGNKWYRSSHTAEYWGKDRLPNKDFPNVDNKNDKIYNLAREAVQLANSDVDFSKYDTDKDGNIDHLMIIHAGNAQESSTGSEDDIWSHRWKIDPSCLVDNIGASEYTMLAETSPLGTFAHELGHDIGDLPDLYDIDYSSDGIGTWGLMSFGAWNYNSTAGSGESPGDTPAHFCVWSKIQMGWIKPQIVLENTTDLCLTSVETTPIAYKIFLSNSTTSIALKEYFLVVFRNQTGFDSFIPGSGVLIWHIDECVDSGNKYEDRKLVDLEEADALIGGWEQLDFRRNPPPPPPPVINDDDGNATDCWSVGSRFDENSFPNSNSNDKVVTKIAIEVTAEATISITIASNPLPWDYRPVDINGTDTSINDLEPSLVEHAPGLWGVSRNFSVVWQSNRSGNWDIWGAQSKNGGQNWSSAIQITGNSSNDYSPSMIIWYPPVFWLVGYAIDRLDRPIYNKLIPKAIQPPPQFMVAFVSNRSGNPEIYLTKSKNFINWTTPQKITDDEDQDIDPCLIQTPGGKLGLFWSSNRTGSYEIYFKVISNDSSLVQITDDDTRDFRNPSYYYSRNGSSLLVFEAIGSNKESKIKLFSSKDFQSWDFLVDISSSTSSSEPSLFELTDGNLIIAYTKEYKNGKYIDLKISNDWKQWSTNITLSLPVNSSSPSLIQADCGSLFLAYSQNISRQTSSIILLRTTQCGMFGVGINYQGGSGSSFYSPMTVENTSEWQFRGEIIINMSDVGPPLGQSIYLDITDTKNTYDTEDDVIVATSLEITQTEHPEAVNIDPGTGTGSFIINKALIDLLGSQRGFIFPTCSIIRIDVRFDYENISSQTVNVSSSIYVHQVPPQQQVQFDVNIDDPTSITNYITSQTSIVAGKSDYGVRSISIKVFDSKNTSDTNDDILYSEKTFLLSQYPRLIGHWQMPLELKDHAINRIVAVANGIYPRKNDTLYLYKQPTDKNAPTLTPLTSYSICSNFPIVFSERITDNLGEYNYGVDTSSVAFSYRIIGFNDEYEEWNIVHYNESDSSWSMNGEIYNYSLSLDVSMDYFIIEYYWTASDLATDPNFSNDGSKEFPYHIIFSREADLSTIYTTVFTTSIIYVTFNVSGYESSSSMIESSSTTLPSTEGATTFGAGFMSIVLSMATVVFLIRRKKISKGK